MLYLNNTGSRWTFADKSARAFYVRENGVLKLRHAECFEQLGNFALVVFKHRGKQTKLFPVSNETHNGLLIVEIK